VARSSNNYVLKELPVILLTMHKVSRDTFAVTGRVLPMILNLDNNDPVTFKNGNSNNISIPTPSDPTAAVITSFSSVRQELSACLSFVSAKWALNSLLSKIAIFLGAVVGTQDCYGCIEKSKPILYVCRSPGTGKTMGIGHCCDFAVNNDEINSGIPPKILFLNGSCLMQLSEKRAMQVTFKTLCISQKMLKRPINGDCHRHLAIVEWFPSQFKRPTSYTWVYTWFWKLEFYWELLSIYNMPPLVPNTIRKEVAIPCQS
jgi:hypothetical protein